MKIIGVAVKQGKLTICLPKPNRHCDCIRYAVEVLKLKPPIAGPADDQGFYLEDGTYLNRKQAFAYATRYDLKIDKDANMYLFSEDLW